MEAFLEDFDTGRGGSDKRAVRRSVVPADIKQLVRHNQMTRADDRASMLHNAALVGAYAALAGVGFAASTLWVWVPAWLGMAFLLHGAYSAMHDAAHGSHLSTRPANRVALLLWALPLGINGNLWRCWHLEHHRATATPDDPEPTGDLNNIFIYLTSFPVVGIMMFVESHWHNLRALVGRPAGYADTPAVRGLVRRDTASMVVIYGLVAAAVASGGLSVMLHLWLIPLATYWCFVSLIFGLPEHYQTDIRPESTQIDVTRTTQTGRITSFIIWNSNRHTAHHLVPTLNYRYLPAVDEALGDRVPFRESSYWRYHLGLMLSRLTRKG